MTKHRQAVSGRLLVSSEFGGVKAISNLLIEIMQQIVSDINKPRRELFIHGTVVD